MLFNLILISVKGVLLCGMSITLYADDSYISLSHDHDEIHNSAYRTPSITAPVTSQLGALKFLPTRRQPWSVHEKQIAITVFRRPHEVFSGNFSKAQV